MPQKALEAILTDKSPNDPTAVVSPTGGFRLVAEGGVISDGDITRFGLTGDPRLVPYDPDAELAAREARNIATYAANAGATKAHQGYPVTPVENVLAPPEPVVSPPVVSDGKPTA